MSHWLGRFPLWVSSYLSAANCQRPLCTCQQTLNRLAPMSASGPERTLPVDTAWPPQRDTTKCKGGLARMFREPHSMQLRRLFKSASVVSEGSRKVARSQSRSWPQSGQTTRSCLQWRARSPRVTGPVIGCYYHGRSTDRSKLWE
jgi:hypothetical protein